MKNYIEIKGAKANNLKNISIEIPHGKFIVITGLSGSGKSTLAFDTLFAEGQRKYIESLSSYARQFLGKLQKPQVEYIKGIPPAIAIQQKSGAKNSRSNVGSLTEIYDFLKLLYSRIGITISPVSNQVVKKHSSKDILDFLSNYNNKKCILYCAVSKNNFSKDYFNEIIKQGFSRVEYNNEIIKISDFVNLNFEDFDSEKLFLVIDRIEIDLNNKDSVNRLNDSIETAFSEGKGNCVLKIFTNDNNFILKEFSNFFELDGIKFIEPNPYLFSYNNPIGACPICQGYGNIIGVDNDLVFPNKGLSVFEGAISCWKGETYKELNDQLVLNAYKFNFPIHKPYYNLSAEEKELLWKGNKYFEGINTFFDYIKEKSYKIQNRVLLSRYRGKTICPECNGAKLRKEALYVKINNKNIRELVNMPIDDLKTFFNEIQLTETEQHIGKRLLYEIKSRLDLLINIGLGYLTLDRASNTLSGGEFQRINLVTSIGSGLVGSLYILDEPSIGLHPRDTNNLIEILKQLKNKGNTVIVVEHDEEIIRNADTIIDLGPLAGSNGGEVVFNGTFKEMLKSQTLTAKYIKNELKIEIPEKRRKWKNFIELTGLREHNLKNIDIKIPLNCITAISGVSGSGKSTIINHILFPAINNSIENLNSKTGDFNEIKGDISLIKHVELIDQNPIGKSSRSNPVTYLKIFDDIRDLFADLKLSKLRGYKSKHFSFNVPGGRCDECEGEGILRIEMQFMADVEIPCEVCEGKRFKKEILEVQYHDKSIFDILDMTIDDAIYFFGKISDNNAIKISKKLEFLAEVGLGYLKLGQSSSTLSGGEAQRIKLALFLSKRTVNHTLFIFDEPTTGLHFHDISKLVNAINKIVEQGHTVLIVEHNLDVLKSADWIIDLGPEGGVNGGKIVFEGIPEDLAKTNSYTGKYLSEKII